MGKPDKGIEEAVEYFSATAMADELDRKISMAAAELKEILLVIRGQAESQFLQGLLVRLLLSAVIEGDRRDTAAFMQDLPQWEPQRPDWQWCINHLEMYLKQLPNGKLTAVRDMISAQCKAAANKQRDIYRLNVPTGAGKTLSSLRFAVYHAKKWGMKRVIYVIPLLTIIEQNAEVIRKAVGDDTMVLEHHSNVADPKSESTELQQQELLTESWDAPIVITTQVQFLNTLFSHKTTAIRRMHCLSNSVIVLDEVQTIPENMLSLFNHALVFLREVCHATIVLCSATQPCLEKTRRPANIHPVELIPHDQEIQKAFKRSEIKNMGSMTLEEIADFALEESIKVQSLLIVCNKKDEASALYERLNTADTPCFYLSTNLCMQHRRDTFKAMQEAKKQDKVICISTQMIESGVDISFGCVIRLQAGMDSIVQAAGRCNRNGESADPANVYVVSCIGENLSRLDTILRGKTATQKLFAVRAQDYDSDESIAQYFKFLYAMHKDGYEDDFCREISASIFDLLQKNTKYLKKDSKYFLNQAFKTAAEHFKVFDDDTVDVLVPYGDGISLIGQLRSEKAKWDVFYLQQLIKAVKPYSISIFRYQMDDLLRDHGLEELPCGALALNADWYDPAALGFLNKPKQQFMEV